MKTKTILSIAIMAALPLSAHATDPVGPAAVPANGTPVVATAKAPYVTQTPTAADATHIASTAYVKGAYNDAIAAVNKVEAETRYELSRRQGQLTNDDTQRSVESEVLGASSFVDVLDSEDDVSIFEESLVSAAGVWAGIDHQLDKKRVDIYTTWDTNNTTQVQLSNVRVQSND